MHQAQFEQRHAAQWQQLEDWLAARRRKQPGDPATTLAFPHLYRQVCHHLALARTRQYGSHLVERLNHLALEGHQHLYGARTGLLTPVLRFLAFGFPALVRREAKLFWLASALFYGPLLAMLLVIQVWPEMAYTVISPSNAHSYEQMYSPDRHRLGRERDSASDILMFGYYIRNNIGIGFQTFAAGILFGLGSIFFLIFNGLMIGAVAGHLTHAGLSETFYAFVIGHGAFELTAITLAGTAGLKIGLALLHPGRQTRRAALLDAARIGIRLVYGVFTFLLIAAFLEAFWSSNALFAPAVKFTVGAALWLCVALYLLFAGRGHEAP